MITNNSVKILGFILGFFLVLGCNSRTGKTSDVGEDLVAKKNMQGIWLDDEDEDVVFRIKGDTVYFPDSTSMPAYFRIENDSFIIVGGNTISYHIVKQTPHLFIFVNQNGEKVKLFKTSDKSYLDMFAAKTVLTINQNKVVKRDTVFFNKDEKYHCYVQVNPTTYKVAKSSCNEDGVEVDNVYYDNIVNLNVYRELARSTQATCVRKCSRMKCQASSCVRQCSAI